MLFRKSTFEVFGFVVPTVLVDVMNVEVRPERIYLAVSVGGQPVEVDVAVVTSSGIPHSDAWVVVGIELYPGRENHADHPE